MKRPDKWRKMAKRIAQRAYRGDCYDEFETILTRALRRTDAAAEKRGIAIGFERSCVAHTGGKFNDRA